MQVLDLANTFQFLNATPNDLSQVTQEIFRTVQSLDFSNLVSFDLGTERVDDLNRKFQELARSGMSAAELRMRAIAELQAIAQAQAGVAAKREADEQATLAYALERTESAFRRAFTESESFRQSVTDIANKVEASAPTLEAFANFFGKTLGVAVGIGMNAIDGFRVLWEGVQRDIVWGAARVSEVLNNIPGIDIDVEGMDEFVRMREVAMDQIAAFRQLRDPDNLAGMDAYSQTANVLEHLAFRGALTVDVFEKLKRATNASVPEMAAATRAVLDHSNAQKFTAEQVAMLEEALRGYEDQINSATDATTEFKNSGTEALTAVREELQNIRVGGGVLQAVRSLGEASAELTEFGDAQAAFKFFQAYEGALEVALNGGAEKLVAFRAFVEEQLRPQLTTEEYDTLIGVIDMTEEAFAGVQAEADRFAGATNQVETGIRGFGAAAEDAESQVAGVRSEIQEFIRFASMAEGPWHIQFSASMDTREVQFATTATSRVPTGGPPGPGHRATPATAPSVPRPSPDFYSALDQAAAAQAASADVGATTRARSEDVFKAMQRAGGGGGGGSSLLDVEAIKAFMQEVNRAIAIAARDGVRIGTAGNAIPFEEGSFLNARGGNLTVDQILIRGVWDFADPAAKRQIIRELQEALEALQAEI
jgi:hypothetical protein